jgi:uncharacterized repeat protein (TIGR01451 family)
MKTKKGIKRLWVLVGVLMVGGITIMVAPVSAVTDTYTQEGDICMQKVFGTPVTGANKLNCTANDIKISRAVSASPNTCVKGTTFDLTATFEVLVTANARYDAGFFFRIDGGLSARGDENTGAGKCSLTSLTIPPPPNPPALNLDGDTCGDLNAGTYYIDMKIPGVLCQDLNGNGILNLPNCTSWHSNAGTPCASKNAADFHPDTKSKCVCADIFPVPVTVEEATLTVTKTAAPEQVPEPGGTVTYTVKVENKASIESVQITSILDNLYGNLGTTNSKVTDNSCPSLIGTTLLAGGTASCTFKASVAGNANDSIKDIVEVCSLEISNNAKVCGSDDATVTISDVYTAPILTKTAQSAANCQLDVTYQVVVSNNSGVDSLSVTSLTDDQFGDITQAHAAGGGFGEVVSTTCGSSGPCGSSIAHSGNCTCTFVGRIVKSDCSSGTIYDTVTATTKDDDGIVATITDDAKVIFTAPGLQ